MLKTITVKFDVLDTVSAFRLLNFMQNELGGSLEVIQVSFQQDNKVRVFNLEADGEKLNNLINKISEEVETYG